MKLTKLCVAYIVIISIGGLSACTTVDLSQVSVKQPEEVVEQPTHNVVERAALSLTRMFHDKGWCKSGPAEMTKTATNVLLNGIDTANKYLNGESTPIPASVVGTRQLSTDLSYANEQVEQTTKAAEVYLVMSEEMAELDTELSQLEAALLSAREAETGFGKSIETSSNYIVRRKYTELSSSIEELKNVTDAYGERIRSQIAARASAKRS